VRCGHRGYPVAPACTTPQPVAAGRTLCVPRGATTARLSGLMDTGWGSADCLWGATPLGPRVALTERHAPDRPRLGEGGSLFFRARCALAGHGLALLCVCVCVHAFRCSLSLSARTPLLSLSLCARTRPSPHARRPTPPPSDRAIGYRPGTESVRASGPPGPAPSDRAIGYHPGTESVRVSDPRRPAPSDPAIGY
jgi:hypothetical protein